MVKVKMAEDCQFLKDLADTSTEVNRGHYNLICSKRDLRLYSKGIKPHGNWKITQVKKYFGITGNVNAMLEQLNAVSSILNDYEIETKILTEKIA